MCVGAGLELNSAGLRPPGTEFDTPGLGEIHFFLALIILDF